MNKTRIAPTPSGFLHLGNVYSFVLTMELARELGAKVLLRIDDLDRDRVERRYVEDIFETLDFLGIVWDEGPRNFFEYETIFSQVHRMEMYRKALGELRAGGHVYACSCSRAQIAREGSGVYPGTCRDKGLSLDAADVSWRVRTPMDGSIGDFVVRKRDGFPAYQLTSLLDDLYFGVDLIVRGQDLRSSTLAQLYLAGLLPGGKVFTEARFYHHELLTAPGGEKLSKSAGATSIQFLRKEGKTREDIYGMFYTFARKY